MVGSFVHASRETCGHPERRCRWPAGVRAPIVAWKPGNAGGAKGVQEDGVVATMFSRTNRPLSAVRLSPVETLLPLAGAPRGTWATRLRMPPMRVSVQVGTWGLPGGRSGISGSRLLHACIRPLRGRTINWRAGCGRSACPVRREGGPNSIGPPYPYVRLCTSRNSGVQVPAEVGSEPRNRR